MSWGYDTGVKDMLYTTEFCEGPERFNTRTSWTTRLDSLQRCLDICLPIRRNDSELQSQ